MRKAVAGGVCGDSLQKAAGSALGVRLRSCPFDGVFGRVGSFMVKREWAAPRPTASPPGQRPGQRPGGARTGTTWHAATPGQNREVMPLAKGRWRGHHVPLGVLHRVDGA